MRKWAGGILGAVLLILLAASCAPRYFCSNCGKIFTGTTYCDAGGEKILCLDCAVRYYSPLAPQKEEWSRGREGVGEGHLRQRRAEEPVASCAKIRDKRSAASDSHRSVAVPAAISLRAKVSRGGLCKIVPGGMREVLAEFFFFIKFL